MKIGKPVKLERLYNSDKNNLNESIVVQLMNIFRNNFVMYSFSEIFSMTYNYYKINHEDRTIN